MGLFGGSDDDTNDRAQALQEEQIETNRAELENKRQSLFQTRLDIIKSQGAQQWTPNPLNNSGATATSGAREKKTLTSYFPFASLKR